MIVRTVIRLLSRAYGKPPSRPRRDPVSELLLTILSQNTSDVNSDRTFETLQRRFPSWEQLAQADVTDIADAIKSGGLSQIKAVRIKETLQRIIVERGNLDLNFLADLPLDEAKEWLLRLPGVGPKTAACVLLFSLGRPALPVDTHVQRVARRLGLIGERVSAEQAQHLLEAVVPRKQVYKFHINMIVHGRRTCHARNPSCPVCVFRDICPSAPAFLAAYAARRRGGQNT
ncbi:MAG: endonuclease III [Dehalococcoidia bacterium]|nr:endonuclease III [Dehalococcoidia bacterium]